MRVPASPMDVLNPSRCFAQPPRLETGAAAKRRKDAVVPPKEEGADKKEGLPKTSPNVLLALPNPTRGGECPTPPTVPATGEEQTRWQQAGVVGGSTARSAAAAA